MAAKMIADLNPGDGDQPIEIKVLRKWISFGRRSEYCLVFVDKKGDAIQATANLNDKNYFDSLISVDTCYRIMNYICEDARSFKSVPHKTVIRIGKAARFQQIPDDGFPVYYFKFLPYDQLHTRLEDHSILTGSTIRKMRLENSSGNIIEATFWDKIALSFDKDAVTRLPPPVIAAITSMKVTHYQALQLSGTAGSQIYINPDIAEAHAMAAEFVTMKNKGRNMFKLAELIAQNPSDVEGAQLTCKAVLRDIDESKGWFYKGCDQCRRKLKRMGPTLVCPDHQPVIKPRYMYAFTANIADETCDANAVFFDDAATPLLQIDCQQMVDELGCPDPYMLPPPITALKGKRLIFELQFNKSRRTGVIEFIVDRVFEDVVTPITTDPPETVAPTTPAIPQASPSEYTTQRLDAPSAQKELFKTSGETDKEQVKRQKHKHTKQQ